ncbi:MAG: hypothetical protein WDW38_008883 [Sanguina aurantia]
MSLENSKGYGLEPPFKTLQDKSRTRLNSGTPHQAPQRERITAATHPAGSGARRKKARTWKELLRPEVHMGVPQLMSILEPNVIWDHTQGYCTSVGKSVEAHVSPGQFFEGWHRGGRAALGVYEGSYWALIGDCEDMTAMLRGLARAPALMDEPVLLTARWPTAAKEYKPNIHALPTSATIPVLRLPPFRAPILETELPFIEPTYKKVPEVSDKAQEKPTPAFLAGESLKMEPFVEAQYVDIAPPLVSPEPPPPCFGDAQFGHDWTGQRPYTVERPVLNPPRAPPNAPWVHPPAGLPAPPRLAAIDQALASLQLEPVPRLELAWGGGPEPEPAYAPLQSPPRRVLSAAVSRPASAIPSSKQSRPASAVCSSPPAPSVYEEIQVVDRPREEAEPLSPRREEYRPKSARVRSRPPSRRPSTPGAPVPAPAPVPVPVPVLPPPPLTAAVVASPLPEAQISATWTPRPPPSAQRKPVPSREQSRHSVGNLEAQAEDMTWEEVSDVSAGAPRVWLNFETPFAELPPLMLPPKPTREGAGGPEPMMSDFLCDQHKAIPEFQEPARMELPEWRAPVQRLPQWVPPCEPGPIGFLRGTCPVLIVDVSGTMNPKQRGRFNDMKSCSVRLLHTGR